MLLRQPLENSHSRISKQSETGGNSSREMCGWRVGRNPPSVLGDIHLIGIPASLAAVIDAYYPFHNVGWFFTLTVSLFSASASWSSTNGGLFLLLNPISRPTSRDATSPPCGWSFLRSLNVNPESPTNSPTLPS